MSLENQPILLIDCQTTGVHPRQGYLLELAWAWTTATQDPAAIEIKSYLVKLPEGAQIPRRVTEITGIADSDLVDGLEIDQVRELFRNDLREHGVAVIHYAQFEKAFLLELLQATELPFETVCTHQLSKKLFPHVPSRNIRALSGYFGSRADDLRRAEAHVRATAEIWRGLVHGLEPHSLESVKDVLQWIQAAPKTKSDKYEYRIDKEKRLKLPDQPGVYRMLSKSGEVLYVGKATSLKERVNSYFRGKRGRDKRKLELMAQVWDLEVTECSSPLEAAVLENDEIKKWDPPYNVSLKKGARKFLFYARDFESSSETQSLEHKEGPFRPFNSIERVRMLKRSLELKYWLPIFYEELPQTDVQKGYEIFIAKYSCLIAAESSTRDLLAFGMRLYRTLEEEVESEVEEAGGETEVLVEDEPITPEEIAGKFERLFAHAGYELWRSRRMTKLLNARVRWQYQSGRAKKKSEAQWLSLELRRGRITNEISETTEFPWQGLTIIDYDRVSIVLSEISRYPHEIVPLKL